MSKRFTETSKWENPWYRKLSPVHKSLWHYLCDKCDQAGVIEMDWELASFQIGEEVQLSDLHFFDGKIKILPSGKILVTRFINFQYGKLSRDCKPHAPVFAALHKHSLSPDDMEQNEQFRNLVDAELRAKIIARDGGICVYTGEKLDLSEIEVDHIIPRSKGGSNKPSNLVTSAKWINQLKRDASIEDFCLTQGWDVKAVFERVSKAINCQSKAFERLQEKEEEEEMDKEMVEVKETEGGQEKPTADDVVKLWNSYDGLKHVRQLTPDRRKLLNARLASSDFIENFEDAIYAAAISDFCTGKNDRGWKADIDWFLKPGTYNKLIEGKYDNRAGQAQQPSTYRPPVGV